MPSRTGEGGVIGVDSRLRLDGLEKSMESIGRARMKMVLNRLLASPDQQIEQRIKMMGLKIGEVVLSQQVTNVKAMKATGK